MRDFRPILYWSAAIVGILLYFFLTREDGVDEYQPLKSSALVQPLERQPAAQTKALFPKKLSPEEFHKSVLGSDKILEIQETLDASGRIRQLALIERPRFKYRLLVSEVVLDSQGHIVSREEKIADHLMVRLKDINELESFQKDLAELGAQIRQVKENSGIYLVQFDGKTLGAIEKMKSAIMNTGKVQFAEEDRVIHLPPKQEKKL
jgi:hypothetical protein